MTVPVGKKLIAIMARSPGVESRTTLTTPTTLATTITAPTIVREDAKRRLKNERIEGITLPFRNPSWGGTAHSEIVIHTGWFSPPLLANSWHSPYMTEEWMLTVADVAEVLGTSRENVSAIIARDELPLVPGRRVRVTHAALIEFVSAMQRDALMLGREPDYLPSIVGSRPITFVDKDDS